MSGRALREPALVNHAPAGHGPSGFDPAREGRDFARSAMAFADAHPEMFDVKYRAIGIFRRATFWTIGVAAGAAADYAMRGAIGHPVPLLIGMWLAAVFVYFDPPKVQTIKTMRRDTDRSGEAGQTAKQAGPKARAGAEGIAQDQSQGPSLNQDSSNG